ncbi:MAG: 1-deoxy-D-xylulose-5-phosphate synthase, partial [Clostridia bacterium]|nr:1-deoxy-D-xylulose-5-phosphate synthase [Clostridia bacterium]
MMKLTPILDRISSPEDLRKIQEKEIPQRAGEIRDYLVETVLKTGGHLASNLGVVELTIALHRVFDTPNDRLIFDVGHQSYVHKLLTGRRDRFDSLRTPGGLSGFTKREESEYDPFGAGHSSTSISAALGFAEADRLQGRDVFTVAVIGDGAFTGGMVHEALNNCRKDLKLVIVLNENEMSISRNIGAFARHIAKIRTSKRYRRAKKDTQSILRHIPLIGRGIYHAVRGIKKAIKNLMYSSNYFEELGLYYIGPVDGNDYGAVERALIAAKEQGEPALVHVRTVKGKGYPEAEADPRSFHSIHTGE